MARKPEDSMFVDEVDMHERNQVYFLLSNTFHLVYADLCVEPIYAARKRQCYGCETDHPSQRHHDCLMLTEEESWNLFYDEAKDSVEGEEVWRQVLGVCYMMNLPLHYSWKTYVEELYKMPWTSVYLLRCQLLGLDNELSLIEKVQIILSNEQIKTREAVPCPEEFLRKHEEPMEFDVKFSNMKLS